MTSRKRAADDLDRDVEEEEPRAESSDMPQIVRRYRHRLKPQFGNSQAPKPEFEIYKAILRHNNLYFQFALRLQPQAMEDLYAIDKEFHFRLNKYSVSLMHDYAFYHAPDATHIFSWSLYPDLCISDPLLKPMDERPHLARDIPSLRWTKMVMWKDVVVREILTRLALEGHRVPRATIASLMKYWILMETPSQEGRESFLQARHIWTDTDIVLFHFFLVKLDMRFAHPVQAQGICELSHLLLTQKSLSTLRDVLTGALKLDYDNVSEIVIRTYPTEDLDTEIYPWLEDEVENGVPEMYWGILSREGWKFDGEPMASAVELVIVEGIRRGLNIQRWISEFVNYGFVDIDSGENLPMPRMWKGEKAVNVPAKGWLKNEERRALNKVAHERFGI